MSIFSRLTDIVQSNLNSLLDRAEERRQIGDGGRDVIHVVGKSAEIRSILLSVRETGCKPPPAIYLPPLPHCGRGSG